MVSDMAVDLQSVISKSEWVWVNPNQHPHRLNRSLNSNQATESSSGVMDHDEDFKSYQPVAKT